MGHDTAPQPPVFRRVSQPQNHYLGLSTLHNGVILELKLHTLLQYSRQLVVRTPLGTFVDTSRDVNSAPWKNLLATPLFKH